MSTYDDILRVATTRQFPNAKFRGDFIREQMQNQGKFYDTYGSGLQQQAQATQPITQPYTAPYTQPPQLGVGLSSTFSNTPSNSPSPTGTPVMGGIFGNSPNAGSVLGTGLGLAGAPFSNVLGQALSGTPNSIQDAAIGTMGSQAFGKNWGPLSGGLSHAISGKMPTFEQGAMLAASAIPSVAPYGQLYSAGKDFMDGHTSGGVGKTVQAAAMFNPATAPLAALYSVGKAATNWNNERLAENHANDKMFGIGGGIDRYRDPKTFDGWFGNPDSEVKGEDGAGITPTGFSNQGLGFNQFGTTGMGSLADMGGAGGLHLSRKADIQGAIAAMFGGGTYNPNNPYGGITFGTDDPFAGSALDGYSAPPSAPEAYSPLDAYSPPSLSNLYGGSSTPVHTESTYTTPNSGPQ